MQEPNNNLKEHPDLYRRSIKGGYWVFAIKFATQFLEFVKSIIIFNFLFKENLELIIVAGLLMRVLATFSESGFRAALVQKKVNIEDYLDTAWVIGILRGILLFTAIYFIAPLFVSFKVQPEKVPLAISVIRAMGLCFVIGAFQNIGTVYFQKELQFRKTFWLKMAGKLTDIVLSITLVLVYKSVWAYVIARLAAVIVNLAMSYLLCSYRPKLHFVPEKARQLWKFGKWLFGAKIIGYLLNEGDDWFVWFYLGGGPLKLYRYAYQFSQMPNTHFSGMISQVSFPAYSKIQDDLPRLRQAYLKVIQLTAMISIPTAFLIFTLGPDFVKLFLVEESHAMAPVIRILAVVGLITSLGSSGGSILRALKKLSPILYLQLGRIALLSVLIYPFTKMWGILGTALAVALMRVLVYLPGLYVLGRLINSSVWKMLQPLLIPFGASISMVLGIFLVETYFLTEMTRLTFAALILTGVTVYAAVAYLMDAIFGGGIWKMICEQFAVIRPIHKRRHTTREK